METIGNLARVYVRGNREDERTRQLLGDIVLKDQRPEWVTWAKERLATAIRPVPEGSGQPPRAEEMPASR